MMNFDGYGMSSGMWVAVGLMMLLFVGGVVLLVGWGVRAASGERPIRSGGALEVLRARLATGEITADEYETTRKVLQG